MNLKFRWDGEEGRVTKKDRDMVIYGDWIVAADFLTDVIAIANEMYEELMNRTGEGLQEMVDATRGPEQ